MRLTKTIYQNNEKVNALECEGESAYIELANLLLQKIRKQYKVTMTTDKIDKTIKASLYFNHYNFDYNKIIAKYKYEYAFTNVNTNIDL